MRVHVFGNCASPAVATYGIRRAAQEGETTFGSDVKNFVHNDFYVDDALTSLPTANESTDLMKRTQDALLKEGKIRLHKIASNDMSVMESFPYTDRAKDLKDLDLKCDTLPLQISLGLYWDLTTDTFRFQVNAEDKPLTKRGVLSTIISLFDPLGFVSPVLIGGRIILRQLMAEKTDWDDPLPQVIQSKWEEWRSSLKRLDDLQIPRTYSPISLQAAKTKELLFITRQEGFMFTLPTGLPVYIDPQNYNNGVMYPLTKTPPIKPRGPSTPLLCKKKFIIKEVQRETYLAEIEALKGGKPLSKDSPILPLYPALDCSGVLKVGGRLSQSKLEPLQQHPWIILSRSHIAALLVRHHHQGVQHQGRHLTEGAVRAAGLWVIGGKRLISSIIHNCVICRKLRGKLASQRMADLPEDRTTPTPPFTCVGVDAFGPWMVVTRRTRGGQANSKRWGILFTCLTTRAIHIEIVEEMSSSSFINSLRRFVAIRGNVYEFRSDRGTNFIGSTDSLKIDAINIEDTHVKEFLYDKGSQWIFNPPHASHMGVWERMIGLTRKILDSMLLQQKTRNLTHEVLCTFLAEECAIVNARPFK